MQSYLRAFSDPLHRTLHRVISFVPRMLVEAILFCLFYALALLIRQAMRKILGRADQIPWVVRVLIGRTIYLSILLLGVLVALSAADVDVTAVITSLGVAGFALGFALKDILENFISGILLLFARPFEVGDQVTLGNYEGTVADIQLRTTTLHTYSGEVVVIPNSDVYTHPVVNKTRLGTRRYEVEFATSLTADARQVEEEALRAVREHSEIREDPPPLVRVNHIDSQNDSVTWRLLFWAEPTKATEVEVRSDVIQRIKRSLFDAGVPVPSSVTLVALSGAPAGQADTSQGPPLQRDRSGPFPT